MFNSPLFPPASIPNLPAKNYYPTDTSNYPSIRNAVLSIEDHCIDDEHPYFQFAGWRSVGTRGSIGVFIWTTQSVMDRRVGPAANIMLDLATGNETAMRYSNGSDIRTE